MTAGAAAALPVLLVGDPASRTVLSGARALARSGWAVHVAGGSPRGLAGWSRCVDAVHVVRAPEQDADGFLADLAAVAARLPGAVALACGDAELIALARGADRLSALRGLPARSAVDALVDKAELAVAARAAGLRVPEPWTGGWPAVVKAAVHHAPGRSTARWEVRVVRDAEELALARSLASGAGVDVVVQEHVEGRLTALSLVLDRSGGVVARAQQVAERIFPVQAGVSARAVTVPVDEALAERSGQLLGGVGWCGLAQLQFLVPASGPPCLIDVNPRLYGSVRLAVAAGAPLPDLAVRVLRGEAVAAVPDARPGVRYQWLLGDVRAAAPRGARELAGVVRAALGAVGAVRDLADPLPAAVLARDLLARGARRALR